MRKILAALVLTAGCLGIGVVPAQAAATPAAACAIANPYLKVTHWGSEGGFHTYCHERRYVAATTAFYDSAGNLLITMGGRTLIHADGQWHWIWANTPWGGVWQPVARGCLTISLDNPGGPLLHQHCANVQ
ncbi:hypothetical protein [Amycolatopsis albispora]|uniref:Streptomyces killer toxin-like beta/gamma crystallin domain-containing protein n=1 Tax=Amycolatopsis albispora TaxID=1804986 RepID=A0A344L1A8_9PSEU|nr:hypothetical protein [Amycolatopsis albispora]AXB41832.1 hypothetical protein A4R43_04220 [Amycolatopsis albispora]